MTDLTDKLADALEWIAKEPGIDANGMRETAQAALTAYRAQRDRERDEDGYRRLQKGEEILQGDQFRRAVIPEWSNHVLYLGERFDPDFHDPSRRPLAKGEA